MRYVNMCPHDVIIIHGAVYDPKTRRNYGGVESIRYPKSGNVASAYCKTFGYKVEMVDGVPVSQFRREFESVTPLPNEEDTKYIVSSLYVTGAKELGKDISNLVVPGPEVYDDRGQKVRGCTALIYHTNGEANEQAEGSVLLDSLAG